MDSAPTPSDDWLIEKLLQKRSGKKSKRLQLIKAIETALKNGLHVYQFWTSTVDNTVPPGGSTVFYIYLTLDMTVYPFIYHSSDAGYEKSYKDFIHIFGSPLVQYSDTWTTVCTNLGWKSGQFNDPYTQASVDAKTYLDNHGGRMSEIVFGQIGELKESEMDWYRNYNDGAGSFTWSWLAFPLRTFLEIIGGSVYTQQYMQDYITACENRLKDENSYENTVDYRNIQGWKMQFLSGWGVLVPQMCNVSEFSGAFTIEEGVAIFEFEASSSPAMEGIPIAYQIGKRLKFLTFVDLEYIIHSFEGPEDRSFKQLPFRATMPLITSWGQAQEWRNKLTSRLGSIVKDIPIINVNMGNGMVPVIAFQSGLNNYRVLTWSEFQTVYRQNTGMPLPDLPPKKNRPGSEQFGQNLVNNNTTSSTTTMGSNVVDIPLTDDSGQQISENYEW